MYTDEVEKETLKLEEMRAAGHDEHDLKQQVRQREGGRAAVISDPGASPNPFSRSPLLPQRNVLSDSEMMVPDTRRRIQAAVDDLEDFLVRGEDERE